MFSLNFSEINRFIKFHDLRLPRVVIIDFWQYKAEVEDMGFHYK